jgi:adenosine deaminase
MLHRGLPVSINPDDPGFWNYDGVTLDWTYAFLAWQLTLADLKKLALNSIHYSAFPEAHIILQEHNFNRSWDEFIQKVIS